MRLLFWCCLAVVAYAYFGYALCLAIYVRLRRQPVARARHYPRVSVVIAARNEEANLLTKLANLRSLDYPPELLEVIVASDGSTDGTAAILKQHAEQVTAVILDVGRGKAHALNKAVERATGDVLLFLDVRQMVDADAVSQLVSCFADPGVGAVSGELLLESAPGVTSPTALGVYWKIEKVIRKLEAETGSVVGVTGAIYAMRRELYRPIPDSTILDDVLLPMQVVKLGKRVIFQPSAIARDLIFVQKGKEFSRKVRTLTGNYQLLRLAPWLLSPRNPLLFRFVSHKLLRLTVPLFLIVMLVTSFFVASPTYRAIFWTQIFFYVLAALGGLIPEFRRFKPVAIASTFVMLNAAAALAFYNFVVGRREVWVR